MSRSVRAVVAALALAVLWRPPAVAAGGPTPIAAWSIEDFVTAEEATDWAVADNGRLAVWIRRSVAKVDGEDDTIGEVWMSDLRAGTSRALTRALAHVAALALSPDGRHVAFATDRPLPPDVEPPEDETVELQLWVMPLDGGEAWPLAVLDREVGPFAWIDDSTLLVAAAESPSSWELERRERRDTAIVVEDAEREPPVRLFTVDLAGKVRRLTSNHDWISDLVPSPDGKKAIVNATRSLSYPFDQTVAPRLFLLDLESGEETELDSGGPLLPTRVRWSEDSTAFYFVNPFTRHPRFRTAFVLDLYRHDLATHATTPVDLDWERGLGDEEGTLYAPAGDGVLVLLAEGVTQRAARIVRTRQGWSRLDLEGEHVRHLDDWAVSRDGHTVVYRTSTATTPPDWYGARLDGNRLVAPRLLTELNPGFADKPTGEVEVIRFPGALGEEVEGLLHYPLDWRGDGADGRRPLVLDVHGGPAGNDFDRWDQGIASPSLLWRQRGAFVLQVNYHGSSGYGLDWVESIRERYYELEIPDLQAGIARLVDAGQVDPAKMAIVGWSNGGILGVELIVQDPRFRAASIGAADVEWFSDWANVEFGKSFDEYYFGGAPWEKPEIYQTKSPFFRLDRVRTPTLVHTGSEDRNVPPHQSWSLFRALQQLGKAETRLVVYPGEPHALKQVAHRRRKLEEDVAWLERHLFGSPPVVAAVPAGSPLGALLARAGAAHHGSRLGIDHDGLLIPETASYADLEVGRFEVTRAQLAAQTGETVTPGHEELPAVVSFAQAVAYVDWLRERTGRPFRLPRLDEASLLAEEAGRDGNTLDAWLGVAANPEDAARAAAAAAQAGVTLLREVGSFPGDGEPAVFDLDGNVAEWAVDEAGAGASMGLSADRPADPRGTQPAAPEYVGFRVVVDGE